MVYVADEARWTNAQGWIRFEVPKNAAYSYTVRKSGYFTIEGSVTVGDGPRHTVNVVLSPTQPPGPGMPTPTKTPVKPSPTLTSPTGEPADSKNCREIRVCPDSEDRRKQKMVLPPISDLHA